jgi:hypothetical protein
LPVDDRSPLAHFISWMKHVLLGHLFGITLGGFSNDTLQRVFNLLRYPTPVWAVFWIVFLSSVVFYASRRRREALPLLCLGFISLQLMMIYLSYFMFRYLYLTLAPVAILVVWELERWWRAFRKKRTLAGWAALGLFLFIFWNNPLEDARRFGRWHESGEITRRYLGELAGQVERHPEAENLFLLSIPYKRLDRNLDTFFWDIPQTQILLEHALEDFLTLPFTGRNRTVAGRRYLHVWDDYEKVETSAWWVNEETIGLRCNAAAEIIAYPWLRLPGRVNGAELSALKIKSDGRGNEAELTLREELAYVPNSLFLIAGRGAKMSVVADEPI